MAPAGQGLEAGGMGRLARQTQGAALLEERSPARANFQDPPDAQAQPPGIGHPGAVGVQGGGFGQVGDRLESEVDCSA